MAEWTVIENSGRSRLGEGVLWSARHNAVFWVDILGQALHRLALDDGRVERWTMPEPTGWVVERQAGGFIAGLRSGFAELELEPLQLRPIGSPEPDRPGNRMNDGKADAAGYIWCGTMDMDEAQDSGAFYRFGPDRQAVRMDDGYRVTNGPAFSPDGRWLYHTDSARRTVYRFPRLGDGGLGGREVFVTFDEAEGYPDGMTVDAEGGLWIAHWDGARVSRRLPDGRLDREIGLPVQRPTNIAFGGERLDRMFVTSANVGLPENGGPDGALLEVDAGVVGLPTPLFPG